MVDFSGLVALPSTVTGSSAFLKFVPLPLLSPTMIVYHSTMGHRLHYINVKLNNGPVTSCNYTFVYLHTFPRYSRPLHLE